MKKLVTLLTLLCLSVWANAEKVKIDGIWYELESIGKTAEVTHDIGTNYSGEVVIPETVTHGNVVYSVTSIGEDAFLYCSSLTGITIGNSVTSIGSWAFNKCSSLTSITIPNSVKSIGEYAFYDCPSLTSITIPDSVKSIGEQTFFGCSSLTSITIPNSVKSIGEQAFFGCSGLTSVTIGNSVKNIGEQAFDGCFSLTSIVVEEGNTVYDSRENCNAIIETATNTLIFGCQSTVIPNSVTSIGDVAFRGCSSLTSITIPNSVITIGNFLTNAFVGCSGLTSIVVEEGNTVYDSRENCNAIIETATNILIFGCQSTVIPNSVKGIGWWAFNKCSSLTSITIPNSVKGIGYGAFSMCESLTSVTIGNSVTSISDQAFKGCSSLTSITIPNSVKSIESEAFVGCSNLTNITIGNSVTSIGERAFFGCKKLTDIYCHTEKVPSTENKTFEGFNIESATLYVPQSAINDYKATEPWSRFGCIKSLTDE